MIREWLRSYLMATVNAAAAVALLAFAAIAWGQDPPGPPPNPCSGKKIDSALPPNCGVSSDDCGYAVGEDHDCSMGESIVISPGPKTAYNCDGHTPQPTHNCRTRNESCGTRYGCKHKQVGTIHYCVQDDDVHADIPYASTWNASAPGEPGSAPCTPLSNNPKGKGL